MKSFKIFWDTSGLNKKGAVKNICAQCICTYVYIRPKTSCFCEQIDSLLFLNASNPSPRQVSRPWWQQQNLIASEISHRSTLTQTPSGPTPRSFLTGMMSPIDSHFISQRMLALISCRKLVLTALTIPVHFYIMFRLHVYTLYSSWGPRPRS